MNFMNKTDFFKKLPYLMAIIPFLYLCLLIISGFYSQPIPEDFGIASLSIKAGVLNAAIHRYYSFDGRYTTNFLHGLTPLVWGSVQYYFFASWFFILSFISGWYYFLKSIYKNEISKRKVLIFSIIFSGTFYAATPHITVWMYQAAGTIVYGLSGAVFLWLTGGIIRLLNTDSQKKQILLLIQSIILIIFIIGLNELIMVFLNLALGCLLVFQIIFKYYRSRIIDVLILLIVCISCSIFVITAPGIGQDVGMDFNATFNFLNIISALKKSATYSIIYLSNWIIITPITFFIFYLVHVLIFRTLSLKTLIFAPIIAIFFTFIILTVCNLTYVIPFNETVTFENFPYRTFSTGLLFYMILHILAILIIERIEFKIKWLNHKIYIKKTKYLILSIIVFSIFFFSFDNVKLTINDWRYGSVVSFSKDMDERYRKIEAAKKNHQKSLIIKVINNRRSYVTDGVDLNCTEDGKAWLRAYQNYFNINIILDCDQVSDSTTIN